MCSNFSNWHQSLEAKSIAFGCLFFLQLLKYISLEILSSLNRCSHRELARYISLLVCGSGMFWANKGYSSSSALKVFKYFGVVIATVGASHLVLFFFFFLFESKSNLVILLKGDHVKFVNVCDLSNFNICLHFICSC